MPFPMVRMRVDQLMHIVQLLRNSGVAADNNLATHIELIATSYDKLPVEAQHLVVVDVTNEEMINDEKVLEETESILKKRRAKKDIKH